MTEVTVRRATVEDVDWLLGQLRDFEAFVARKRSLLEDEAFARTALTTLIEAHVVLVAHDGSERHGFIAGGHAPHPFNPNIRVLSEFFWWVVPIHRYGRASLALLTEFERIGRETADWIMFCLDARSPVREAHLIKRGFRQSEMTYLLEV